MHKLTAALCIACFGAASFGGQPPASVRHARFSCDGQHLLAQTDAGIVVATVRPFRPLFTIPDPIPGLAQFTPDSRSIVLLRPRPAGVEPGASQFERWSLPDGKPVQTVVIRSRDCHSEALSPDGGVLACVEAQGTLRLIEVSSGKTILENKKFSTQAHQEVVWCEPPGTTGAGRCDYNENGPKVGDPGKADLSFSPDGRFLIATPIEGNGWPVAFDFREGHSVRLRGALTGPSESRSSPVLTVPGERRMLPILTERVEKRSFMSPELVVVASFTCKAARPSIRCSPLYRVVAFPSGKEVASRTGPVFLVDPVSLSGRAATHYAAVAPATAPAFLLEQNPSGKAVNYQTGELVTNESAILDVYGRLYVTDSPEGSLKLFDIDKGLQGTIAIPHPAE